jgi:hypothetical protein
MYAPIVKQLLEQSIQLVDCCICAVRRLFPQATQGWYKSERRYMVTILIFYRTRDTAIEYSQHRNIFPKLSVWSVRK